MFDPEEFRKFAGRLTQDRCGPAESRSAISRSYYAVFLVTRQLLGHHFIFDEGAEEHVQVRFLLKECSDSQLKELGSQLKDFRDIRNEADYNLASTRVDSRDTAVLWMNNASRMIQKLKALLGLNIDPATLGSMKNWAITTRKVRIR